MKPQTSKQVEDESELIHNGILVEHQNQLNHIRPALQVTRAKEKKKLRPRITCHPLNPYYRLLHQPLHQLMQQMTSRRLQLRM
jgi:hypothetical protein